MLDAIFDFLARLCKAGSEPATDQRCDKPAVQAETSPQSVAQVQQLVGRVSELTTTVAQDVGQHNKSVQAISAELTSVAQNDPSAVAAIVCKLLVANQELQGRLERAEHTLQSHSRELHDAVTSAKTDALTVLPNRRALDETLNACIADLQQSGKPATLMMLDVDRFKQFNDTYGHLIGDKVLRQVADVLRTRAESGDFLARFGGEEFVVVFGGQTASDVRQRAESMRRSIGQRPVVIDGCNKPVTASGGLAELTEGESVAEWLKRADAAMYAAKGAGRDCAFEMNQVPEKIVLLPPEVESPMANEAPHRPVFEAAAELAAEAFADTGFVPSVARRIAEWRRGGTTLTVLLARLDHDNDMCRGTEPQNVHVGIRIAMHAARACLREMDLITRWQDDGIAILLPNTSGRDAKAVARRLRNALSADSIGGQVTMCMGIAEGIEGNDAKRVLERAWLALDAARSSGPSVVAVHDGLKPVVLKLVLAVK